MLRPTGLGVNADVVDMYFDSTGDIPQTVELCGAQMVELCGAQTVEHCLVGVSDTSSGNLLRPPEPEVGGASAIVLPPGFGETPSPGAAAIVGAMLGHSSPTIVRPPPGFAGAPAQAQEKAVTGETFTQTYLCIFKTKRSSRLGRGWEPRPICF